MRAAECQQQPTETTRSIPLRLRFPGRSPRSPPACSLERIGGERPRPAPPRPRDLRRTLFARPPNARGSALSSLLRGEGASAGAAPPQTESAEELRIFESRYPRHWSAIEDAAFSFTWIMRPFIVDVRASDMTPESATIKLVYRDAMVDKPDLALFILAIDSVVPLKSFAFSLMNEHNNGGFAAVKSFRHKSERQALWYILPATSPNFSSPSAGKLTCLMIETIFPAQASVRARARRSRNAKLLFT